MAYDPMLQLDLDFAYEPSELDELSSAQLTVLASSLHSKPVNPFDAAEARKRFTARRGKALASGVLKPEEAGAAQQRAAQSGAPRSIVRLGPEWGILATSQQPEHILALPQPHHTVLQSQPLSPPPHEDRPAPSPPRQLASVDLTSSSDDDGDEKAEDRSHRHSRRHSRSRSPSRRRSHHRSRSEARSRSRSPSRHSHRTKARTSKRPRSPSPSSYGPPLDNSDTRIRTRQRVDDEDRRSAPARGRLHEPDWNWQSMKTRFPNSVDLLHLPSSIPALDTLPESSNSKMPPEQNNPRNAAAAKMRKKCQLESLCYLYASFPQHNLARIMPTMQHVAALRDVAADPQHPLYHFHHYWQGLSEVRRCWARVRDENGGAGGSLWSVVTRRLQRQEPVALGVTLERAHLLCLLEKGLADPRSREGFVKEWKMKQVR